MTYSTKAGTAGQLPVIATLGEGSASPEMGIALNDIALRLNAVSSDEIREQVFNSLVVSILMGHPDPVAALMRHMGMVASAVARAQRQLGQGGSG